MADSPEKPARYRAADFESRWQETWAKDGTYTTQEDGPGEKYYALVEFPYPSGDGLHVGHVRSYTAMDIIARKRRMQGYRVLFPMGWDAFGLPTENFAIKTGTPPALATKRNTDTFRGQLKKIGFSFDWDREVNTTDPAYYKWTQWMFIQFFKAGLAYKKKAPINWCPVDNIGLANEEVINGHCERCGSPVEQREKEQWMMKITAYAEQLLEGLKDTEFLPAIKAQQTNWIGKAEGLLFSAPVKDTDLVVETYSSHFEAFVADTFVVIAPDHPFLEKLLAGVPNADAVHAACAEMIRKRQERGIVDEKEIEGVFTGRYVVDPVGNGDLPIWVASFALADYGTGIIRCSAHDARDFAFAKKYDIPLKAVLVPEDPALREQVERFEVCYADMEEGILLEPSAFKGKKAHSVRQEIIAYCKEKGYAVPQTFYKLRDWIFSRQRYWGEPVPMIFCETDGWQPVPDDQLPVVLPEVKEFRPGPDGESPLAAAADWIKASCPVCGREGRRETDVMPNWAGSSWYFLRYTDPHNDARFADIEKMKAWMPVDWYNGGMEHVTLHLLYSRFWNRFLFDQGLVPVAEPYRKRTAQGMILGEGGKKMSKSKGNVVNPDSVIASHGADTLRTYEMFMGPFDQAIPWDPKSIEGVYRFLARVFMLANNVSKDAEDAGMLRNAKKAARKVSSDIEQMSFNTAVSALMIWSNEAAKADHVPQEAWELFLKSLAPFAPHLAEELWHRLGHEDSVHLSAWPEIADDDVVENTARIAVQISGKTRDEIEVAADATQEQVEAAAKASAKVQPFLTGEAKRVIYVPGRIINFVL